MQNVDITVVAGTHEQHREQLDDAVRNVHVPRRFQVFQRTP